MATALTALVLATGGVVGGTRSDAASTSRTNAVGTLPDRPDIVFVLTDDLSRNLVQYMPQVRYLQSRGTQFTNMTVTDSLCCPSRASIFTGMYPHDTGVVTNLGASGGFQAFHANGLEHKSYNRYLHDAGYRTAMMGKYLNFYDPDRPVDGESSTPYVPTGWDDWDVVGDGYPEYDYDLTHEGGVVHHGSTPEDYLTDVLGRNARRFITDSVGDHQPFMLELSTFSPHAPSTPAPVDAASFPGLKAPVSAAYDTPVRHAPDWLAGRAPLTAIERTQLDRRFRSRVQSVQSVDRVIGRIRQTLQDTGAASNTIIVFSSDNGFHIGQYRLTFGKNTAFDSDLMVPLVVAGPGIRRGAVVPDLVQTVDLAPTLLELGGAPAQAGMDGRSLVDLLTSSGHPPDWRTATLSEHTRPAADPDDPDQTPDGGGNPPSYQAMRTARYTYVEYVTGERELYDRLRDPQQLDNVYAETTVDGAPRVSEPARDALHRTLARLVACTGSTSCAEAGAVPQLGLGGQ